MALMLLCMCVLEGLACLVFFDSSWLWLWLWLLWLLLLSVNALRLFISMCVFWDGPLSLSLELFNRKKTILEGF